MPSGVSSKHNMLFCLKTKDQKRIVASCFFSFLCAFCRISFCFCLISSHLKGKRTGLITTARITHATPGAAYAHTGDRSFEAVSLTPDQCQDVATQLVVDNPDINVSISFNFSGRWFSDEILPILGKK